MEPGNRLSEKWIKASITGTIWAASEIVLGSFLHNLKVPFTGNILTAIGLIILISISIVWTERGLFWRAGLICALLKTMSPSAVIFGPMIAIFAESLLLELFVRLLGRNYAGFITGAMAAMSWNLFQQITKYIIIYGSNIIAVYTNLLKMAQKQLDIQTDIVWLPIIILLISYALFGSFSAMIGIRVGKRILKQPPADPEDYCKEHTVQINKPAQPDFNYSITWLIGDLAVIIASFFLLNKTSWIVWSLSITAVIVIWSLRYKRALRQLSKPKFWLFFVIITLLTAFVFTKAEEGENLLIKGLLTGLQMNFRAAIIIIGFSVLGTELYNPVIRNFFLRTSFKNLPLALELSAESLPSFIANIPDFKTLVRNPVSIFSRFISQADRRLAEIRNKDLGKRKIFIITGAVGQGKTTFAKRLAGLMRENNIKTGGIISERSMNGLKTTGYDIVNIETWEKEEFLREDKDTGSGKIGRFFINKRALEMGSGVLRSLTFKKDVVAVIDEVGMLEVAGKGWAGSLDLLLNNFENHIILVVRDVFIEKVRNKWNLSDVIVFNIGESDFISAGEIILREIRFGN